MWSKYCSSSFQWPVGPSPPVLGFLKSIHQGVALLLAGHRNTYDMKLPKGAVTRESFSKLTLYLFTLCLLWAPFPQSIVFRRAMINPVKSGQTSLPPAPPACICVFF